MGETLTALDCPGSLEFLQETLDAVIGVDAAVIVVEAAVDRAVGAGAPAALSRHAPHPDDDVRQ